MTRRARSRSRRGHLLIEALFGGVVLLLAVAAIGSALTASDGSLALASMNQQAQEEALAKVEILRAQPLTSPAWTPGTTSGNLTGAHANWTWQIQIVPVSDVLDGGLVAPTTLTYRRAFVTITYGPQLSQTVTLETYKW